MILHNCSTSTTTRVNWDQAYATVQTTVDIRYILSVQVVC